ncbi:MAG: sel1 repeat family protein [Rhodospirillaceae bacterium]|jgi:uncharacterized protein|nr:sel1 repeat family protein [Rhodospirillaceae bacterium]
MLKVQPKLKRLTIALMIGPIIGPIIGLGVAGMSAPVIAAEGMAEQCREEVARLHTWIKGTAPPIPEEEIRKIDAQKLLALDVCGKAHKAEPKNGLAALQLGYANMAVKETELAAELFEKAADSGDPIAQVTLARMLATGKYMIQDRGRAQRILHALAKDKSTPIGLRLTATMEFMPGRIGPEKPRFVRRIFDAAIAEGSAEAMIIYATKVLRVSSNDATPEQAKEGVALLRRAADELNDVSAMIYLALMHAKGLHVEESNEKAIAYSKKAIDAGSVRGYGILGQILQNAGDLEEAFKWMKKGAEAGDPFSQGMVGFLYNGGFGVGQDMDAAVMWWKKARWNGNRLGAAYMKVHREQEAARIKAEKKEAEEAKKAPVKKN